MTPKRAFRLIENLDVKEKYRRFAPRWSAVVVDKDGVILDVIKYKESPNYQLHQEHMRQYPQSVQFTAWPGRFRDVAELEQHLAKCVMAHRLY